MREIEREERERDKGRESNTGIVNNVLKYLEMNIKLHLFILFVSLNIGCSVIKYFLSPYHKKTVEDNTIETLQTSTIVCTLF